MSDPKNTSSYDNSVHRLGRGSTSIMLLALLAVPTATAILFNVQIDINKTVTAFFGAFSLFGVIGTIEFFSYAPVLGAGGQYLSSITGNISNMKLPAALSGIKLSKFEPGSKEAEVVSTIAIAISSLVTTAIVFFQHDAGPHGRLSGTLLYERFQNGIRTMPHCCHINTGFRILHCGRITIVLNAGLSCFDRFVDPSPVCL